jgi:preprotein translocase subunit SecY
LLIVLFAVFFGLATFDPDETARKLKDAHGFVPGFRPGEMTARHLWVTQTVLVTIGAAYLVTVCTLPDLIYRWTMMWPPFGGYQLFLLAWLSVHTVEQIRPFVRP